MPCLPDLVDFVPLEVCDFPKCRIRRTRCVGGVLLLEVRTKIILPNSSGVCWATRAANWNIGARCRRCRGCGFMVIKLDSILTSRLLLFNRHVGVSTLSLFDVELT